MTDRVRILLVEDNDADVYLFRKALSGAELNYDLIVIEDGGRALAFFRDEEKGAGNAVPDLAIIDMSLPKNDGIQVVEAMRQAERFAQVPVVVVSSSAKPPAHVNLERLRVARYITKPPDLESFLQTGEVLKEILVQSQAQRLGP
jgi:CheY-like chemotaxis protein